jgi:hypothetical protein
MIMGQYLLRFPENTPELTYEALTAYEEKHWHPYADGSRYAPIGTTVTITKAGDLNAFDLRLYGLTIARIFQDQVFFPLTGDAHMATREWLGKIVRDNGIGSSVWRIRRRTTDGPGPYVARGRAGLLCIDGNRSRPVEGHGYPVDRERIAREKERAAQWAIRMEADRAEQARKTQRENELSTYVHPVLGTLYAHHSVHASPDSDYHWEVTDSGFADTLGFVRDDRADGDTRPSPEPEDNPLITPFEAFTREGGLIDTYSTLQGALAGIAGVLLAATGNTP